MSRSNAIEGGCQLSFQLVSRDGQYGYVQCTVTHNGKRCRFSTGDGRILIAKWDKNRETVSGQSLDAVTANERIREVRGIVRTWFADGNTSLAGLRALVTGGTVQVANRGIAVMFDSFLKAHRTEHGPSTVIAYTTTKRALEQYEEAVGRPIELKMFRAGSPQQVNEAQSLEKDISQWLTNEKGYNDNTRSKALAHIATVLRWHERTGQAGAVRLHTTFTDKKTIRKEEAPALTSEDLQAIEAVELEPNTNEWHARNGFLLGCYTGLRFSDWNRVEPARWRERLQLIEQTKTGGVATVLHTEKVRSILKHYETNGWPPCIANRKNNTFVNRLMKDVSLKAGLVRPWADVRKVNGRRAVTTKKLYELVTTHTARRTFVTLLQQKGESEADIMRRTGHSTLSSLRGYDKTTSDQLADKYGVQEL